VVGLAALDLEKSFSGGVGHGDDVPDVIFLLCGIVEVHPLLFLYPRVKIMNPLSGRRGSCVLNPWRRLGLQEDGHVISLATHWIRMWSFL
jgi:hypothetical protein